MNICKRIKLKYGTVPDNRFNARQLKMGIKVETEHTNNRCISKQIAKAHLSEDSAYYTHLAAMEKKYKK